MSEGKGHDHSEGCKCVISKTNPSVQQTLEELGFERSIFQAAIDNDVKKIEKFSSAQDFDVNARDSYGYCALHYAARAGSLEAVKHLQYLGADLNLPTGSLKATALHRAVSSGRRNVVTYLLDQGADITLQDSDGLTPIDRAVREKRTEILNLFKT